VSRPILGAAESPRSNVDLRRRPEQLLDTYRAGLRRAVHDADRVAGHDGWACLETLWRFFESWFTRPDWFVVWALIIEADASSVDDAEGVKAMVEGQQEERSLLDRVARSTGAADPTALGALLRIIVYGSGTAAALDDDGYAAAEALRLMLARAWQEYGSRPLASS
jgi:hypothetical protein